MLHSAGIRILGPIHFFDTEVGGSLSGVRGYGLLPFGRQVMRRMRELGMIVDLAHGSHELILDVASLPDNERPWLMLSHTGVKEVCDHARNYAKGTLRLVAQRRGLIGVALFNPEQCDDDLVMSFVRSVAYLVQEFGIESVGLGSDWDGSMHVSVSSADVQVLEEALSEHTKLSESDVRKVMHENVYAFFESRL